MLSSIKPRTVFSKTSSHLIKFLSTYTREPAQALKITLPNGLQYEQPVGIFINNKYYKTEKTIPVENPSTEEVVANVYAAESSDVDYAVESAKTAFEESWRQTPPLIKGQKLVKLADLMQENKELIASIESFNNGKTMALARGDVQLAINYFRSTAGHADKLDGRTINNEEGYMNYTIKEPIGVCGQILPWNFPLLMLAWKLAPAYITGNTVIIKPASATPLSALFVASLLEKAGIPEGVVSILPGSGRVCGESILTHPQISKISFTGSTNVGKHVLERSAQSSNLKKVTLELGGKSPHIVFDDCNFEKTFKNLVNGIFMNAGQICSSGSRIYIQDTIYDKFIPLFKQYIETNIKVGSPFDPENFQGAITNREQFNTIMKYIDLGKESKQSKLLTGGERVGDKGYFIKPTVFYDVPQDETILKEEIFGPVVTISKFSTMEQVVKMCNDSIYGLGAGIQTENISKALKIAKLIKSGTVWVNTYNDFNENVPFGGFKLSGIGKEMGIESLDSYIQTKAVRIKLD
ncbi:hypothetical protein WICPIJ_007168 [Wickerhamomyces pijperi]|uniref:Aldehyde dehydrogenase domain-containing protein n=1 Tax=Wickerhamomyces pijperi TaxID=599730 RepID=A0A9P8Q116_WICPI|nr:hypothetical protein WICPIJ_007168 [Wickerhamomyces pijperi]